MSNWNIVLGDAKIQDLPNTFYDVFAANSPEISRQSLRWYWALSSVLPIALRAMSLFELVSACITFVHLMRPAIFSVGSLDCSRSLSYLAAKYSYEVVRCLKFSSSTTCVDGRQFFPQRLFSLTQSYHDISLIFTYKNTDDNIFIFVIVTYEICIYFCVIQQRCLENSVL